MWNWIGRAGWVLAGVVVGNILGKSETAKEVVDTLKKGSRQILNEIKKDFDKKVKGDQK